MVDRYLNEFNARDLNKSDDQISKAESSPNVKRATRNRRLTKTLVVGQHIQNKNQVLPEAEEKFDQKNNNFVAISGGIIGAKIGKSLSLRAQKSIEEAVK